MIDFRTEAEMMRDELVARRRDFHRHPELAFEEFRTAGIIADELRALGMEVQTGVGKTGVVGILEGAGDGPTVLVRSDMDALPIQEENAVDYASTVAGKMHACGHDGHMSIVLGVAKLMTQYRERLNGRIKFVFQPAEEIANGADAMIRDGVLENPRPDVTLGLHLWNYLPLGTLGLAEGPVMAGASDFKMVIRGKGGHAGTPHLTVDPLVCAAQVVLALQTIVSRNVSPLDTAVVSVTYCHAGTANNVIPQMVELGGTFRTLRREVRDAVEARIREIAEAVCAGAGCTCEVAITHYTIPVVNHPEVTATVRRVFSQLVGDAQFRFDERTMAAEDVSALMDDIPGMYFFVGCANSARGLDYGHHHPRFDFDEDALPLGVALLSAAVAEYTMRDNHGGQ